MTAKVGVTATDVVLDTWIIRKHVRGKRQIADEVQEVLSGVPQRSKISMATLGEAESVVARTYPVIVVQAFITELLESLDLVETDLSLHRAAAWLRQFYFMSFADSYVAATTIACDGVVWTGDPELLCADRIWGAQDLREPSDLARASNKSRVGFRRLMADQATPESLLVDIRQLLGSSRPGCESDGSGAGVEDPATWCGTEEHSVGDS